MTGGLPGTYRTSRIPTPRLPYARQAGGELGLESRLAKMGGFTSHAPRGVRGLTVPDDIGALRQAESQRVTRRKLGGRSISNPL